MFSLSAVVLEKTGLGIALLVVLVIYVVMSLILRYHWDTFGIPDRFFERMRKIYHVVSTSLAVLATILYGLIVLSL